MVDDFVKLQRLEEGEAILDGRLPKGLRLAEMLGNGPLDWDEQRVKYNCSN